MALENTEKLIWAKRVLTERDENTIMKKRCNTDFQGEAKLGASVKILTPSDVTVDSYTKGSTITYESLKDTSIYMAIDQADKFSFLVEDMDAEKVGKGYINKYLTRAGQLLALKEDKYICEVAGRGAGAYSASTAVSDSATMKALVDSAMVALWENGVQIGMPLDIYLTPWAYKKFQNELVAIKTDNDSLIAKGLVGTYDGANVYMTNSIYNDNTDDYLLIKTPEAVAFADGLDIVEKLRHESLFADKYRGLNAYGAKVVRPKEVYVIKAREAVSA